MFASPSQRGRGNQLEMLADLLQALLLLPFRQYAIYPACYTRPRLHGQSDMARWRVLLKGHFSQAPRRSFEIFCLSELFCFFSTALCTRPSSRDRFSCRCSKRICHHHHHGICQVRKSLGDYVYAKGERVYPPSSCSYTIEETVSLMDFSVPYSLLFRQQSKLQWLLIVS